MTIAADEPPPQLVIRIRRDLEALVVGRNPPVSRVRHDFHRESSARTGAVYGWGTTIQPVHVGELMWLWFDELDKDLVLQIGRFGWFEWFDLEPEAAVADDVVSIMEAVMAGHAWEYKTWRGGGCEVCTRDGRLRRASNGRDPVLLPAFGTTKVRWRRQVSPYNGE